MDLVCHTEKALLNFEEIWSKYARTILEYSISHLFCSKDVREALIPLLDDDLLNNHIGYGIGMLVEFYVVWVTSMFVTSLQMI